MDFAFARNLDGLENGSLAAIFKDAALNIEHVLNFNGSTGFGDVLAARHRELVVNGTRTLLVGHTFVTFTKRQVFNHLFALVDKRCTLTKGKRAGKEDAGVAALGTVAQHHVSRAGVNEGVGLVVEAADKAQAVNDLEAFALRSVAFVRELVQGNGVGNRRLGVAIDAVAIHRRGLQFAGVVDGTERVNGNRAGSDLTRVAVVERTEVVHRHIGELHRALIKHAGFRSLGTDVRSIGRRRAANDGCALGKVNRSTRFIVEDMRLAVEADVLELARKVVGARGDENARILHRTRGDDVDASHLNAGGTCARHLSGFIDELARHRETTVNRERAARLVGHVAGHGRGLRHLQRALVGRSSFGIVREGLGNDGALVGEPGACARHGKRVSRELAAADGFNSGPRSRNGRNLIVAALGEELAAFRQGDGVELAGEAFAIGRAEHEFGTRTLHVNGAVVAHERAVRLIGLADECQTLAVLNDDLFRFNDV